MLVLVRQRLKGVFVLQVSHLHPCGISYGTTVSGQTLPFDRIQGSTLAVKQVLEIRGIRSGFYPIINTYLILLVSFLALSSPHTAHEQGRDTISTPQEAAYGISYPLLGDKKIMSSLPPIFEHIARCESGGKQFDDKGAVIRGEINSADMGKYQINTTVWKGEAQKLGIDLSTEEGNEQFALELYQRYGTLPWESSKPCWGKMAKTFAEK